MASEPSRMPSVSRLGEATEPAVEVVAADHDGRADLAGGDELVEAQAGLGALAVAEPADARRQPLERHAFLRHSDPARERLVLREQLEHGLVGAADVRRIARQRDPAERALALGRTAAG